ncbi:hypothetical protein ABZ319_38900, partial [Nocardia sp. NPDC005978]
MSDSKDDQKPHGPADPAAPGTGAEQDTAKTEVPATEPAPTAATEVIRKPGESAESAKPAPAQANPPATPGFATIQYEQAPDGATTRYAAGGRAPQNSPAAPGVSPGADAATTKFDAVPRVGANPAGADGPTGKISNPSDQPAGAASRTAAEQAAGGQSGERGAAGGPSAAPGPGGAVPAAGSAGAPGGSADQAEGDSAPGTDDRTVASAATTPMPSAAPGVRAQAPGGSGQPGTTSGAGAAGREQPGDAGRFGGGDAGRGGPVQSGSSGVAGEAGREQSSGAGQFGGASAGRDAAVGQPVGGGLGGERGSAAPGGQAGEGPDQGATPGAAAGGAAAGGAAAGGAANAARDSQGEFTQGAGADLPDSEQGIAGDIAAAGAPVANEPGEKGSAAAGSGKDAAGDAPHDGAADAKTVAMKQVPAGTEDATTAFPVVAGEQATQKIRVSGPQGRAVSKPPSSPRGTAGPGNAGPRGAGPDHPSFQDQSVEETRPAPPDAPRPPFGQPRPT